MTINDRAILSLNYYDNLPYSFMYKQLLRLVLRDLQKIQTPDFELLNRANANIQPSLL